MSALAITIMITQMEENKMHKKSSIIRQSKRVASPAVFMDRKTESHCLLDDVSEFMLMDSILECVGVFEKFPRLRDKNGDPNRFKKIFDALDSLTLGYWCHSHDARRCKRVAERLVIPIEKKRLQVADVLPCCSKERCLDGALVRLKGPSVVCDGSFFGLAQLWREYPNWDDIASIACSLFRGYGFAGEDGDLLEREFFSFISEASGQPLLEVLKPKN